MTVHPRSIPKPVSTAQLPLATRLSIAGSWLLLWLGFLLLGLGLTMLVQQIQHTPPSHITVVGKSLTAAQRNTLAQSLQPLLQGGYFATNLVQIRDKALSHSWLDQVSVTRRWPNGIVIQADAATPVAKWGAGHFVNSSGRVFKPFTPINNPNLPTIYAQDGQAGDLMQDFYAINQWFNPIGLFLHEYYFTSQKTAILIFSNGMRVVVDKEHTQQKLQQLSVLLRTDLYSRKNQIASADLRYRSGLAVRWRQ